jgi:uncharacterized membrane protein YdbT with pleckstrin-like domain
MVKSELVIPKVWRSEIERLALFLFFCVAAVVGSDMFPVTVIEGRLITIGNYNILLRLPLLWFVFPFTCLSLAIHKVYNVRYTVDNLGVEVKEGILSLRQVVTKIRYEDIRSVEIDQGVIDRMLDIGTLEISTASTSGIECVLEGVEAPEEVRDMLNRERDAMVKIQAKQALSAQQEVLESLDNQVNA